MKWQLIMLGLATIIVGIIGGAKWQARLTAATAFATRETTQRWTFAVAQNTGVKAWSRSRGSERVKNYDQLALYEGFDVTSDFSRVAVIDNSTYGQPRVKVLTAVQTDRPIAQVQAAKDRQVQCPLFDADGAVLFFESTQYGSTSSYSRPTSEIKRFITPEGDHVLPTQEPPVDTIDLPAAAVSDDCFEISLDGTILAWLSTDMAVHVGRRTPNGIAGHKSFPASDFALSPDGTWLAVNDGSSLSRVEIATGAKRQVPGAKISRVAAISPDGTWIAAETLAYRGNTAFRVSDGAPVGLALGQRSAYGYDVRRRRWFTRTGGKLPDPTPTPKGTPRPRRTPR